MNNSVGFKIKKLREQKEMSQEDLAFQLEVSQSYLSKIENGSIEKLDFIFMQKVAEFFKVEPQYFLEGDTFINDIENNNGMLVNNFNNSNGIVNNVSEDLLKNVINNQQQISQLMEMQNKLIEKMLKEK
ncbi:helix-turn-helix transcriptional regulator [Chryseobacterium sp. PS-8]|jgi:transcriptional regulator with XRE-family HTH domain|uniref:Helix-turn-helix transcriptional regulator n=1 Tax=Chryseobacterium indicum TaxID=2766954 RepID=A0ABS9C1D1_9FLAO|nr:MULTISPECIES: helix-turn-helix transcriptional regulator [Chryseobacterium]MCF2218291.1 helix-turn-helix transcriptional regulator [Chryseobacterium sp. PS-8]MDN4028147.1 helix-turn-helix transcriptional regulator [Chryseobacterium gambrini]